MSHICECHITLSVSRWRGAPAWSVITHFASSSITAIVKSDRMFGSGGNRVGVWLGSCVCARVTVWCPRCPPVFVLRGSAGRTESSVLPYIIPPSVKRNNAALRYQTWRPCHVNVCVCSRTHLHCVFVQLWVCECHAPFSQYYLQWCGRWTWSAMG